MKKTIKEKADEILEKCEFYINEMYSYDIEHEGLIISKTDIIHTAILSVTHNISVLNRMKSEEYVDFEIYSEQTEILKELKSRI